MVVILIGIFVAFAMMFPVVVDGFEQINDAQDDRHDRMLDRMNSDFEVIDADSTDTGNYTLTVRNTGSVTFEISAIDLILDGAYHDEYSILINGEAIETNLWKPGEELTFESDDPLDDGAAAVYKVVTEFGVTASGEF